MKNFLKPSLLTLLILSFTYALSAQSNGSFVPTLDALVTMPKSPEAAAFAKYGNQGISHYSGTPNISIPLGGIQGRAASLPVTLTYDASGIGVEQIATWVGLGWNLNLGGAVTREVKGLPDDCNSATADPQYYPFYSQVKPGLNLMHRSKDTVNTVEYFADYFLHNDLSQAIHTSSMVQSFADFISANNSRTVDLQPDLYRFSAMGISGSMYIDYENEVGVSVDDPTLKIEVNLVPENLGRGIEAVIGWTITDGGGNEYYFNRVETTTVQDNDDNGSSRTYNSAWYLTQFRAANGRDIFTFYYSASEEWEKEQIMLGSEVLGVQPNPTMDCPAPSPGIAPMKPTYKINQFYLDSVRVNSVTRLVLDRDSTDREDLSGRKALQKIHVNDIYGNSENVIRLNQSYFTSSDPTEFGKRLRLDGVDILGANSAADVTGQRKEYSFAYNDQYDLPSRKSLAQDHWGLYNGASNESNGINGQGTLIPADAAFSVPGFDGANRNPSFSRAITGTLKKITYPTGGTTEFHFEPHRINAEGGGSGAGAVYEYRDVYYANQTLDGYHNTQDPAGFGSCGVLDNTPIFPDFQETTFTVPEDGGYTAQMIVTDDISQNADEIYYAIIYEGGPKNLCEIVDDVNQTGILFSETGTTPSQGQETRESVLQLQAGVTYTIMLVSNNDLVNVNVFRNEAVLQHSTGGNGKNAIVGGFRIKKIVDMPDSINVAQTTEYSYYQEDGETSSGILQSPYYYLQHTPTQRMDSDNGTYYTCDMYNRYGSNRYIQQPQIVSYSRVEERKTGGPDNGYTLFEFYNKPAASMIPSTNQQMKNGKLIAQTIFDSDNNPIQKSTYDYEQVGFTGSGGLLFENLMNGNYDMKLGSNVDSTSFMYIFENMAVTYLSGGADGQQEEVSQGGWIHYVNGDGNWTINVCTGPDCLITGPQSQFRPYTYHLGESWVRLRQEQITSYNPNGEFHTVTQYFRDPTDDKLFYPRSIASKDSRGNTYTTTMFYPQDYDTVANNIYDELVAAHRLGEAVRTQKFRLEKIDAVTTDSLLLQDQKTLYSAIGNGIYPETMQYAINGAELEDRIKYEAYDGYGNPIHISKDGLQDIQYQWDLYGTRPVAQVVGIKKSETINMSKVWEGQVIIDGDTITLVPNIPGLEIDSTFSVDQANFAYTSFETINQGGWAYNGSRLSGTGLPSGNKYYNVAGGAVSRLLDPDLNYQIGFWAQNSDTLQIVGSSGALLDIPPNSEWTYHQLTFTDESEVTITWVSDGGTAHNFIDEVRIGTSGLQFTTYAYDTAGRLISQVGPNGTPVHYKYDAHGRLTAIKDQDHNIIKLIKYGYKETLTSQN